MAQRHNDEGTDLRHSLCKSYKNQAVSVCTDTAKSREESFLENTNCQTDH